MASLTRLTAATAAPTLTGMSFSFSAAGTKADTLSSLGKLVHQHDSHSQQTADLVTAMVEAGPAETEISGQAYDAIYSISAYGHSSAGHDLPSLGISFSASFKLRETPAVAVEEGQPGE